MSWGGYRVVTASPVQSSEQMATAVIWAAVMANALSLCFVMYLREGNSVALRALPSRSLMRAPHAVHPSVP